MAKTMWRAAKGEGVGNVFLEQVPVPEPGSEEVLTRTRVSLISRGSELWRRYVMEGPVSPSCTAPASTSSRIAGARNALIQSKPAGLRSSRMRASVSMPRSPTSTTR